MMLLHPLQVIQLKSRVGNLSEIKIMTNKNSGGKLETSMKQLFGKLVAIGTNFLKQNLKENIISYFESNFCNISSLFVGLFMFNY